MKSFTCKPLSPESGLSLLELMVALTIIGILATVGTVAIQEYNVQVKNDVAESNLVEMTALTELVITTFRESLLSEAAELEYVTTLPRRKLKDTDTCEDLLHSLVDYYHRDSGQKIGNPFDPPTGAHTILKAVTASSTPQASRYVAPAAIANTNNMLVGQIYIECLPETTRLNERDYSFVSLVKIPN